MSFLFAGIPIDIHPSDERCCCQVIVVCWRYAFTMWLLLLILAVSSCHASPASLEVVNDDELVNLFRSEKYVVVLFSKYRGS